MSTFAHELDFSGDGRMSLPSLVGSTLSAEGEARSDELTTFVDPDLCFWGMAKVAENISDVIVKRLTELPNVKAIRMGRSGDVYHVWTMVENWTAADRKAVYAAQRDLLCRLTGFELDFYVVKLDANTSPDELVSDIPTVFPLAS